MGERTIKYGTWDEWFFTDEILIHRLFLFLFLLRVHILLDRPITAPARWFFTPALRIALAQSKFTPTRKGTEKTTTTSLSFSTASSCQDDAAERVFRFVESCDIILCVLAHAHAYVLGGGEGVFVSECVKFGR